MTADARAAYAAPPSNLRLEINRGSAAGQAELPRQMLDILRQRGLTSGPVLLLTRANEAAAPLTHGELGAVVMMLDSPFSAALEPLLAGLSSGLKPGTLLVLHLRAARFGADDREKAHLTLLRVGFERVWAHTHRGALCISATRAAPGNARKTCSIVVPVYNEKETFPELMHGLLEKRLDHLGLEREIIVVESNSTDGTREQVAAFANTPGVRILWQDRPRGKGHAVRAGFEAASGDIVLIQDADLEYDLNDYDALLEPLLHDRSAFVLGSRHSGGFRMRRFTNQRLLGSVLDIAHLVFTGFINVLYGQNMKDPFTMFKVFRRDCLYGLTFECNRFDFDHELVIKLVLKGYRPLEIPVNYWSRSFKQGKKIRMFRDPPGWIAADLRYRLRRLRPEF